MNKGNFRVRVLDTKSEDFIVDKVYEIVDGVLVDDDGFVWTNGDLGYGCFQELADEFSPDDQFQTTFELVEE